MWPPSFQSLIADVKAQQHTSGSIRSSQLMVITMQNANGLKVRQTLSAALQTPLTQSE